MSSTKKLKPEDAMHMAIEDEELPDNIQDLIKLSQDRDADLKPGSSRDGFNATKMADNGQYYTGMSIGGSHLWNYDQGQWKETKMEPDLWKIDFETHKRRAHHAPKGSGVPVGTQYHWLVVAHQYVEKLDEDTYSTKLVGHKYKLAHKNISSGWSIKTVKGQRDREIALLKDAIERIEGQPAVHSSEKIKENVSLAKGQQTISSMFSSPQKSKSPSKKIEPSVANDKSTGSPKPVPRAQKTGASSSKKRKHEDDV